MKNEVDEFKDEFLLSIIEKTDRKVLKIDFDKKIMSNIKKNQSYKKEISTRLKKSILCFFVGILTLGIYSLLLILKTLYYESFINILSVFSLFISIIFSIIFIDNYKRYFKTSILFE